MCKCGDAATLTLNPVLWSCLTKTTFVTELNTFQNTEPEPMFCFAVWFLHFPLLSSVEKRRRQSPCCCCSLPGSQGPSHPSSRLTNLGCILELLINPLCEDVGFDTTPSTRTFSREQKSLLHGSGIPPWCSHKSFEPSVGAPGLAAIGRGSPQAQGSHLVQTPVSYFRG